MAKAPKKEIRLAWLECVQGHQFVSYVPQVGHGTEESDEVAWVIESVDNESCWECGSEISLARSKAR